MPRESPPFPEKHAPIVELALLRLLPPYTTTTPSLLADLTSAQLILQANSHNAFTGVENPFHFYSQVEDPSLIYIIGSWPTRAEHHRFLDSAANKALLNTLKDQVHVEWMFHVDVPIEVIPLEAPVLSMGRYKLPKQNVSGYTTTLANVQRFLVEYVKPHRVAHGRRIDKEVRVDVGGQQVVLRDQEELVLFCGWESVERHMAFARTKGYQSWRALGGYLLEAEERHAVRLEL